MAAMSPLNPARFQIRAVVGLSILLGVFVCLLGRLFYIQVIQENRWEKQADAQQDGRTAELQEAHDHKG